MYRYEDWKPHIFTEDGQKMFLKIRDKMNSLCDRAGAVTMGKATSGLSGTNWEMFACVDRLVELEEFRYVDKTYSITDWVLVRSYRE